MIIESLCDCYAAMRKAHIIRSGWEPAKVYYGIDINKNGTVNAVVNMLETVDSGKKAPIVCDVPARKKRSTNIVPNAFADTSTYLMGRGDKKGVIRDDGDDKRQEACFVAAGKLHEELLRDCTSEASEAVRMYFLVNTPASLRSNPLFENVYEDMTLDGKNIVLMYAGAPIGEYDDIAEAWDAAYSAQQEPEGEPDAISCVSGKPCVTAIIHPLIRGLKGGLATGNSLCSCNIDSFRTYGRYRGNNYPMSYSEANAYTGAINYLLKNPQMHVSYDNVTLLIYSRHTGFAERYGKLVRSCLVANKDIPVDESTLRQLMLGRKVFWDGDELDPEEKICLLMLVPNYARIAIIDFREMLVKDIAKYTMRYRIKTTEDGNAGPSAGSIIYAAVRRESASASADVNTIKDVVLAIIAGKEMPYTLAGSITMQVRTGKMSITAEKAKIIALALASKGGKFMTTLDQVTTNPAYIAGRLLAICESMEYAAYANSTSKPRPFMERWRSQVLTSPKRAISVTQELMLNFGGKLKADGREGVGVYYEKLYAEVMGMITAAAMEKWPDALSVPEQAMLLLGFSHQQTWNIETARARKEASDARLSESDTDTEE